MSKFVVFGETIMNVDKISAVWIIDNHAVCQDIKGLSGLYSVQFEIDCGGTTHTTYSTGFPTRESAKEALGRVFSTLKDVFIENDDMAATSGKPKLVMFDDYENQWVKARLTYHASRLKAIQEGEVYMIKPYMSCMDKKCVEVRNCLSKGAHRYYWKDVQFELVEEGGQE